MTIFQDSLLPWPLLLLMLMLMLMLLLPPLLHVTQIAPGFSVAAETWLEGTAWTSLAHHKVPINERFRA